MASVKRFIESNLAESIDSLITLDIKGQGVIPVLYQAARELSSGPLVLEAARSLVSIAKPGSCVFLCTGFRCDTWEIAESDGVVGTVVLARALELGLNIHPIILCEPEIIETVKVLVRTSGLHPDTNCAEAAGFPHSVKICAFTTDEDKAPGQARELLDVFNPISVVSIERPGKNSEGVYHAGNGVDVSVLASKIDYLFELRRENTLTIAIGDLGNELGLGGIKDTVREAVMYGRCCQCPCKGGIACTVEADRIIVAAVSDWGAYGLAAEIAFVTGKPEAFHDGDMESELLLTAAQYGLTGDSSGYCRPGIDGIDRKFHVNFVKVLRGMVDSAHALCIRPPEIYKLYEQMRLK